MSAPLLSLSAQNDALTRACDSLRGFICSKDSQGPRFGALTRLSPIVPVHLFDAPALAHFPDVFTDGAHVFVRASVFEKALAREDANPRGPALALLLAGLAKTAGIVLGFDEREPMRRAIQALGPGRADFLPHVEVGSVAPERLARLLSADHPGAAAQIAPAPIDEQDAEMRRQTLVFAFNQTTLNPGQAEHLRELSEALALQGIASGAVERKLSDAWKKLACQPTKTSALFLANRALSAADAHVEAQAIGACAAAASGRRAGPRV